jgi:hypothetical protein
MKKFYLLIVSAILLSVSAASQVVINEVYGAGGNTGAPFTQDYVELYNNSATPIVMASWSIQYTSANGTTWGSNKTIFSGTIAPNSFFLIGLGSGANGIAIPTPDAAGSTGMSATAGKIVLCNNSTTVSAVVNPVDANIVDKVGYGATATGFETAPAPAPSNTTSIFRVTNGTDTDNNSTDFQTGSPFPQNSAYIPDNTPPTVSNFSPADDAVNVATNSNLVITFSEAIKKNISVISLVNTTLGTTDYVYLQTSNTNVTVTGNTLIINGINLQPNTNYYITMADTAVSDLANNKYAGISNNTTWNFSTNTTPIAPIAGIINNTYNLNVPASIFSTDGFKQYSTNGPLVWEATTFGNPTSTTPGVQMNGFFAGTNTLNEDWFISPVFDLTATAFPLLSFYSITKFNGAPLKLKVSTNYPGYGNPNSFTWTDLNGKFPAQTSNAWTLSNNINLSAYKTSNTYFAFVYNSTNDDGQRCTLDDIRIDNSPTAPPASLTVSTTDVQFGYIASGGNLVKTFAITGNDITSDIALTATANFSLSADGVSYTPSITLPLATSNNVTKTIYVKFEPSQNNANYTGTITITTTGATTNPINLKGTSIDPINTLEVVNWNLEWFGSSTLGPTNDNLQETNIKTITQNIGADLFGFVEVISEARLQSVVNNLNSVYGAGTYSYVICNYGSHVNPFSTTPLPGPISEAQKEAFVYKTAMFTNITTTALLSVGINTAPDLSNPDYNYWASGRYPYMMSADVTLNGITKNIKFVLIHAKANTAPTIPSYNRRKNGADNLHNYLNATYPTDNIMILGDFNDDLDQTITDGIVPPTTSYSSFTTDPVNFYSPTLPLSLAGKKSTVSYNDVIDHVYVSNEMQSYYLSSTASILTDVADLVNSYGSTTTDHYPVFSRFAFDPVILPITLSQFVVNKENTSAKISWATEQETNTSHFIVERSFDGRTWNAIVTVAASGNSSNRITYNAYDNAPMKGINYYRLKQIDKDAKFEYSAVKTALFKTNYTAQVSPNPAKDFINLYINKLGNKAATIILLNADGKVVYTTVSPQSNLQISTTGLSHGLYFVKVIDADNVTTLKVVVQ